MSNSSAAGKDVFISYRRAEKDQAGRLHATLSARCHDWTIFFDTEAVEPGVNFVKQIEDFIAGVNRPIDRGILVLAVIGGKWNPVDRASGRTRLKNERDYVRHELETALSRNIPIMPVLLEDTGMPAPDELPETLAELHLQPAVRLRHEDYPSDIKKVITGAELILSGQLGQSARVQIKHSDRRTRALMISLRHDQYLVHYRTLHTGAHFLSVDGHRLTGSEVEVRSSGQRLLHRSVWYRFQLIDGNRLTSVQIGVRYMTELLIIRAFEVKVNERNVYSEGIIVP
ncbi:toll/interleukin-1 receptor domain-containing protein [Geodermatophilus sp. URMC 63]